MCTTHFWNTFHQKMSKPNHLKELRRKQTKAQKLDRQNRPRLLISNGN